MAVTAIAQIEGQFAQIHWTIEYVGERRAEANSIAACMKRGSPVLLKQPAQMKRRSSGFPGDVGKG